MDTHSAASAAGLLPILDGIPGPWGLMAFLLFATFILHLVLMNTVVGLAVISFVHRVRHMRGAAGGSAKKARFTPDLLLPKGVALLVNFGIPPFLFIQCLFAPYIYASSVLMALWWLSVMMLVMLAYYGLYINMARRGLGDGARLLVSGLVCLLLLVCAFFFVNNMTLMQSPERWIAYAHESGGLFLNIADPQVVPRWLHILLSCLAVGGLALALPAALKRHRGNGDPAVLATQEQEGLRWFFYATMLQLPVGGWFLLSLPVDQRTLFMGGGAWATALFVVALLLFPPLLWAGLSKRPLWAGFGALCVILLMAGMRTELRASMLAPYDRPEMRAVDVGPLMLFLVSLVLSAAVLAYLARLYKHRAVLPEDIAGSASIELEAEALHAFDEQTDLVIEIGQEGYLTEDGEQAEHHDQGGNRA